MTTKLWNYNMNTYLQYANSLSFKTSCISIIYHINSFYFVINDHCLKQIYWFF